MTDDSNYQTTRRKLLQTAGAATTLAGVAGCLGGNKDEEDNVQQTKSLNEYSQEQLVDEFLGDELADRKDEIYESKLKDELVDKQGILDELEGYENVQIEDGTLKATEEDKNAIISDHRNQYSDILDDLAELESRYESQVEQEISGSIGNTTATNETTGNISLNNTDLETANVTLTGNQTTNTTDQETTVNNLELENLEFSRVLDIYTTARQIDNENTSQIKTKSETNLTQIEGQNLSINNVNDSNTTYNISELNQTVQVQFNESTTREKATQEINQATTSYADTVISNFENIRGIEQAYSIGETYAQTGHKDIQETTMLQAYLDGEITDAETQFLNETTEAELPTNPLNNQWAGQNNQAMLDLGLNPLQEHELLNKYQIAENGNNTYSIQHTEEEFTSTVNSNQLQQFAPTLQKINQEFENPQTKADRSFLGENLDRQGQMQGLTEFSLNYLNNTENTETIIDMSEIALIDKRDQQGGNGEGLASKISFFNTFDQAWNNQNKAFQFAQKMVDEDNLEQAKEAGLNMNNETYRQATEDGNFPRNQRERLTEDRLEELQEETQTGIKGEFQEPDIELDNLDDLDPYTGGSSSTSNSGGGNNGGGGGDGGSGGGGPPNGGGGPGGR